jgi:hypothetical protein
MSKSTFPGMDERTRESIRSVATILYFVTIQALVVDILYRQLVLKQSSSQFEDLAIILVFNVVVFLMAIFWKGGISFQRIRIGLLSAFYLLILALGSLLGWFLGSFNDLSSYWPYLGRMAGVGAILIGIYVIVALLGKRRLDRIMED